MVLECKEGCGEGEGIMLKNGALRPRGAWGVRKLKVQPQSMINITMREFVVFTLVPFVIP